MGAPQQALLGYGASAAPPPTPDILWWKMNDGSGTTVTATVGPNGTTDAAWVTGASGSGSALDFNGSSQKANSASSVTYGSNVVTLCFWAFFDDNTPFQMLFESTTIIDNANTIACYIFAGSLYTTLSGAANTYRQELIASPSTGVWRHIAIIYDGSTSAGDVVLYFDGVAQTTTLGLNTRNNTSNMAANTAYVGARAASGAFFNGRLDDLRIFARALTPTEILSIVADPQ